MLRNLPNDYTCDQLLELLDERGFQKKYDFAYIPMDFKRGAGLGYAFVNMVEPEHAQEIWRSMDGFNTWKVASQKTCVVAWGAQQGLEAHVDRYRNSPVMHKDVPEQYKPVLFSAGIKQNFPKP